MTLFLLLSLIHLCLWCIHFSNIHVMCVDGVAVPIAFVCFISFFFPSFHFVWLYNVVHWPQLPHPPFQLRADFLRVASPESLCIFRGVLFLAYRYFSRFFSLFSPRFSLNPLCIWILIHFSGILWFLMGIVICNACFHISCTMRILVSICVQAKSPDSLK